MCQRRHTVLISVKLNDKPRKCKEKKKAQKKKKLKVWQLQYFFLFSWRYNSNLLAFC